MSLSCLEYGKRHILAKNFGLKTLSQEVLWMFLLLNFICAYVLQVDCRAISVYRLRVCILPSPVRLALNSLQLAVTLFAKVM